MNKETIQRIADEIKCSTCKYEFSSANLCPCEKCVSNPRHKDFYTTKL